MSGRAPSRLRRWLRTLADPQVIGWPMFWISYVLFALDRLPIFGGSLDVVSPSQATAIAWYVTASQVGTFVVLLLARLSYLSTQAARRHPSWTVLTFLVAAFIGDVIGTWASSWAEPLLGSAPNPNALGNAWVKALALCVIGVILETFRQHRSEVTALEQARERLLATEQGAQRALQEERTLVIDELSASVARTLDGLSTDDPEAAASSLRTAAHEIVRPLSHELATREPEFTPVNPPGIRPATWRAVLTQVPATPLIAPLVMAAVVTVLASRLTVRVGLLLPADTAAATSIGPLTLSVDLRPLVEALLALTAVFIATWLSAMAIRRLSMPILEHASVPSRWALTAAGILAIGITSQLLIGLAFRLPGFPALPQIPPLVNLLLVLPLLLIALIVGTGRAISIRQQSLRTELRQANDDLAWEVARANEALWQQRRRLAHLVHGPLQAALNAGSLAIDMRERMGTLEAGTLERIRTEVRTALDQLADDPLRPVDPADAIAQAQRLWSDVCRIEVEVPAAVYAGLGQDPVTASTAIEIVSEACANAVIHGHATQIQVGARIADARSLEITVADNGQGADDEVSGPAAGLGTRFLDDVSLEWSRLRGSWGTTLNVRLPARLGT